MPAPLTISSPSDFAAAYAVSRETADRLALYADLLRQWQRTINLVAPSTLDAVWQRHMADSAQLLALAPATPEHWVDVGSGAGFPGLVIAILLAEHGAPPVTLVESDTRKAAFLAEVARRTGVTVDIRASRIEKPATRINLPPARVVSARALAPLGKLLALTAPYLRPDGTALFLKGRDWAAELSEAEQDWHFTAEAIASRTDAEARVLRLTRITTRGSSNRGACD